MMWHQMFGLKKPGFYFAGCLCLKSLPQQIDRKASQILIAYDLYCGFQNSEQGNFPCSLYLRHLVVLFD